MSATSQAEQEALLRAEPYRTVTQRKALLKVVLVTLKVAEDYDTSYGFATAGELLLWVLMSMQGPGMTLKQAADALAKKPLDYGSKKGELGSCMRYELRGKKFTRWAPPGTRQVSENWLTLERLLFALDPNSVRPTIFPPFGKGLRKVISLDTQHDPEAALDVLLGRHRG